MTSLLALVLACTPPDAPTDTSTPTDTGVISDTAQVDTSASDTSDTAQVDTSDTAEVLPYDCATNPPPPAEGYCDGYDAVYCEDGREVLRQPCDDGCAITPEIGGAWCTGTMPINELNDLLPTLTLFPGWRYHVSSNLTFDTLTLKAGAQLTVSDFSTITINDALISEGTEQQPVQITSALPFPEFGDWGMLVLQPDSVNQLDWTTIAYGGGIDSMGEIALNNVTIHDIQVNSVLMGALTHTSQSGRSLTASNLSFNTIVSTENQNGRGLFAWNTPVSLDTVSVSTTSGTGILLDSVSGGASQLHVTDALGAGVSIVNSDLTLSNLLSVNNDEGLRLSTGRQYPQKTYTISGLSLIDNRHYGLSLFGQTTDFSVTASDAFIENNGAAIYFNDAGALSLSGSTLQNNTKELQLGQFGQTELSVSSSYWNGDSAQTTIDALTLIGASSVTVTNAMNAPVSGAGVN